MANRYWVGGSANWDGTAGTKWATTSGGAGGASVPTTADDVFFDANSGIVTCTVVFGHTNAKSITCTGYLGELVITDNIALFGSLTLSASMLTYNANTATVSFRATGTVTTSNRLMGPTVVDIASGTLTLADNFEQASDAYDFTLTRGTVALGGNTLKVGGFKSFNTNTRNISNGTINIFGYNRQIAQINEASFTIASTVTLVLSYSGSTGTRLATIGYPAAGWNTVNVSAGSDIVGIGGNVANLSFTGFSGTFDASYALTVITSLTFSSSMGGTGAYILLNGPVTINTNNAVLNCGLTQFSSSTSSLVGNLTISTLSLSTGPFSLNGYNLTATSVSATGPSELQFGSGSAVLTITGSGTSFNNTVGIDFTCSGTGTINMSSSSAKTFAGGSRPYPVTLRNSGSGALTISGNNTIGGIENTVQPTTFTLTAGSTQTITTFNINGTAGNLVTINSSSSGSQATLSKSSGLASGSYLSIQDSVATGGATWSALNSTDGGNNTGWIFGPPPSGNMLALFM